MGRFKITRGAAKRRVDGKALRLADEVRYMQRRAVLYDNRIITIGRLLLFSAETGDAFVYRDKEGLREHPHDPWLSDAENYQANFKYLCLDRYSLPTVKPEVAKGF